MMKFDLPPGVYVIDCSPYGPPKLLSIDPAELTPEKRKEICEGINTFSLHKKFALESIPGGDFKVIEK